jgi:hypothetical protein
MRRAFSFCAFALFAIALQTRPLSAQSDPRACDIWHHSKDEHPNPNELMAIAGRPDGLHQAAIGNGGCLELGENYKIFVSATSLQDLTNRSSLIVAGQVTDTKVQLEDSGRKIVTHFTIQVETALKGTAKPDGTVDFAHAGGKITFDDGTIAKISVPMIVTLQPGHRYVLFLSDKPNVASNATYEGQSIFELDADGQTVHPQLQVTGDTLADAAKYTQVQFLEVIREFVALQNKQ